MLSGSLRGALGGVVGLVVLETLVTSKNPGQVASLFQWPAAIARWFIDPSVPGLPDRSKTTAKTTPAAAAPAATPPTPAPPAATVQGKLAPTKTV